MKKLLYALSPALFILPAVINTLVVLWIWVYPWLDQPQMIRIPWQMLLALALFWISGILLGMGKWYGGIPAAAVPLYICLENITGYAGMSHISWFPIAVLTICYYALCGLLAVTYKKQITP